jgi:hypothetical protein
MVIIVIGDRHCKKWLSKEWRQTEAISEEKLSVLFSKVENIRNSKYSTSEEQTFKLHGSFHP